MAIYYRRDDNKEELELSGNGLDLVAEVSYMVNKVYRAMRKQDPKLAEVFKELTMKVIGSPDSPAWL